MPPHIHAHAAIGDGRSVALVASDGTIDWLCWPRFDSSAIFSALIDDVRGGYWRIAPRTSGGAPIVTRAYLPGTNVLETRFTMPDGVAVLTDTMSVDEPHAVPHNQNELVRRIACQRGVVEIEVAYAPRPEYARHAARLKDRGTLGIRCESGAHLFSLYGERPLAIRDDVARTTFVLHGGEAARFSLTFDEEVATIPLLGAHADARIEAAARWWRAWLSQLRYDGPDRDDVVRSLLATKLLSFAPSGAIVAAPTTSLPERVGGDLNWDYRFCWLRDASFTARAFYDLGFRDDAVAFCGWLLHATRLTRPELRILYDVYGRPPGAERELAELPGHRGSRPVRVRNGASDQLQLDCYGEVLDAAFALHEREGLDRETRALLGDLGRYVLAHWRLPDHGIWEERGAPLHRTHSRVLCWVALDRLRRLRRRGGVPTLDADALDSACDEIHADVVANAWNESLGCYTHAYGTEDVDASTLLLPYYGFEPATSARMVSTYRRVEATLRAAPGLFYRNVRGLRVGEGAFGICSAWVVDFLARAGRTREARRVLRDFSTYANDVGLFAEEIDVHTGEALGNFPQAYTHVGLLAAALSLREDPASRQGAAA